MIVIRLAAFIAALAATVALAPAQQASAQQASAQQAPGQQADGRNVLQCEGAFARDSSHAKLVQAFGKSSVAVEEVDRPDGTKTKASVVYPDEPRRRVEVLWHDEAARSRPATIRVDFKSQWRTVRGLRIGSDLADVENLADVEKINGKPFKLMGFDWNYGGRVSNWMGGALATVAGGCDVRLGFNPWADAPDAARDKVSGDKEFLSSDANMRASKPTVSDIFILYPR
jgi:hypothetical protein